MDSGLWLGRGRGKCMENDAIRGFATPAPPFCSNRGCTLSQAQRPPTPPGVLFGGGCHAIHLVNTTLECTITELTPGKQMYYNCFCTHPFPTLCGHSFALLAPCLSNGTRPLG